MDKTSIIRVSDFARLSGLFQGTSKPTFKASFFISSLSVQQISTSVSFEFFKAVPTISIKVLFSIFKRFLFFIPVEFFLAGSIPNILFLFMMFTPISLNSIKVFVKFYFSDSRLFKNYLI